MAYQLQCRTPAQFAAAGFAAVGTFGGATSGIGSGVGYEPLYYVNAENNTPSLIGWRRSSNTDILLGNGAGTPLAQVLFEGKVKFNSVAAPFSDLGFTRWIFHVGDNSIPVPKGWFAMYVAQNGALTVQWGVDSGVHATANFAAGSPLDLAFTDLAWHKLRIEAKKVTLPLTAFFGSDIKVYLDDVLYTPNTTSNSVTFHWDSSVPRFFTLGGLNTGYSWHLSMGDILLSDDVNAQLYEPADDIAWALNVDSRTNYAFHNHPSDPSLPVQDLLNVVVVDGAGSVGFSPVYNQWWLEDPTPTTDELTWSIANSFPQDVNLWDRDFSWYVQFPGNLNSVGAGASSIIRIGYDISPDYLLRLSVTGTVTAGSEFALFVDTVNNTWVGGTIGGNLTASQLNAGPRFLVTFVQSTGVLSLYQGVTLVGTRTLTSVNTPMQVTHLGVSEGSGATAFALLKESRIYTTIKTAETIVNVLDAHNGGAISHLANQVIFDNHLWQYAVPSFSEGEVLVPDFGVGYRTDISGPHPTGAKAVYGKSFYSVTAAGNNAVAWIQNDTVPGFAGPTLLNQAWTFVLTDYLNCDGVQVRYQDAVSLTVLPNMPQITFNATSNQVIFAVPGSVISDIYSIAINPGSRCIVQYNETTKEWAMQVDGVVAGISTYDPDSQLPLAADETLSIVLVNPASYPAVGFSDYRNYTGWIDGTFEPLSAYQVHPVSGTFPAPSGDPPAVDQGIPDQVTTDDVDWIYQFPSNAYTDPQADNVYTATLDDDSPLPAGMTLNGDRTVRTFTWLDADAVVGIYLIKVRATNVEGFITDTFQLTVNAAPAAGGFSRRRYLLKGIRR